MFSPILTKLKIKVYSPTPGVLTLEMIVVKKGRMGDKTYQGIPRDEGKVD